MSHALVPPRVGERPGAPARSHASGCSIELLLPLVSFLMKPRTQRIGAASGMRLQKLSRRLLAR